MYYSDNPVRDAERYYNDLEKQAEKLPVCSECGYRIDGEKAFEFNGEYICEDCLIENHRVWVEDLISQEDNE